MELIFADSYAKLFSGHSESAPAHISAASARRRGPTLAIKLSRCCEMGSSFQSRWKRRERVRASPRQLCQLRWRRARAGGFLWSSGFKVDPACRASLKVTFEDMLCRISNLCKFVLLDNSEFKFAKLDFLVGHICTVIHTDRLDSSLTVIKDRGSQDSMRIGDIVAMQLCELQKVRDEQAQCESVCLCQFPKDRDEQARCRSIYAMSMRW